jgi:hypothetical protein
MNAPTQLNPAQCFPTKPLQPADLADLGPPCLSWLWHGFLAAQKVTALISPPKSGKTTLVSLVLTRVAQAGGDGSQLAGLPVRPGRALVVSEEAPADWAWRCRHLGIGQNVRFLCRPFQGALPTDAQWQSLIAAVEELHRAQGLELVVIDPLATLLPSGAESCGPKLLACLLPLQKLASQGPAVWLMHHPAKDKRADGQAARGSGALAGFADIVMELSHCRRARSRDRRRRICAYARYEETPRHLIIELNPEGTDYLVRTDATGTPLAQPWPELHALLAGAQDRLTQEKILLHWPREEKPDRSTLARWLKRATQQGVVCCDGSGYRGDPFRYWLPGREPLLFPGWDASEADKQAWRERWAAHQRSLQEGAGAG